jgi:membrane protease subunit HflK
MYTDAMQDIYTNVTKVLVDTKAGSNLLYLPLDKIMQMTGPAPGSAPAAAAPVVPATSPTPAPVPNSNSARSRERESR